MANMIVALVQEILMAIFGLCAIIGNGFILYVLFSNKKLRRNGSLYLIIVLASVDFILGVTIIPYIILLLTGWGFTVDYPPLPMVVLVMPVTITLKISMVLDCAIAIDRLTAIQWPVAYKMRKRSVFAAGFLAIGILWGAFEVVFIFATTEMKPNPGCAVAGCFFSMAYNNYNNGFPIVFIDSIALITTVILMIKIYLLKASQTNGNAGSAENEGIDNNAFKRANRAAVSVLLCSSVTILGPGCLLAVAKIVGFSAAQQFGPFTAFGLILNAAANPFIYGFRHQDIRHAVENVRNNKARTSTILVVRTLPNDTSKS